MKYYKWPIFIAIPFLLLSFLAWPFYGFYTFMKFVVTGTCIYYAYYLYEIKKQDFWFWGLVIIGILFNPIAPIYLRDKTLWGFIDLVVIVYFIVLLKKLKKYEKN